MSKIPDELTCPLCEWLLEEAVMLPCCAASVCDPCAKDFLKRTSNRCPLPDCQADDTQADDLIPNRRLRSKATDYRYLNIGFVFDPLGRPTVIVLAHVRPKTSKSSDNHCRPGLWAGRVDH